MNLTLPMKKPSFLLILVFVIASFLFSTCAKINKDQPCGNYNGTNEILYKDSSGNCYYIDDNTGKHIYVTNSTCNC